MKRVIVIFFAILLCVSCQSSDGLSFRTFSEKCEDSIVSEKANTAELICNLTYPIGKSKINEDIREWLNQTIMQEFAATHENDDSPEIELSRHADNLQEAFRDYSSQYYKWVKKEYSDDQGELYPLQPFYVHFSARPVVDNARYITYFVEADIFFAGAHGTPHAYYRTYDKKLEQFVSCDMLVKKEHMKDVCRIVYAKALKKRQELFNSQSLTTDFTDDYPCGDWSNNKSETIPKDKGLIPLQHIAILPQGIVVSYHPYQIGAFLEGDYHILVPFKNIGEYLLQDISFIYSNQDTQK